MKKLFTAIVCLFVFQSYKAWSQPTYQDTTLDEQNLGQSYLQSYKSNVPAPVMAQLQQNAFENSLFKIRLDSIQKDVPLDYNEFVQSFINNYTSPGRRAEMGRIMGLSKYYFPI
jgi:membrane-bound lytic murein transglycosylase D